MQRIVHKPGGHDQIQKDLVLSFPNITQPAVVLIDLIDQVGILENPKASIFLVVCELWFDPLFLLFFLFPVLFDHLDDLVKILLQLDLVTDVEPIHKVVDEILSVPILIEID